MGLIIIKVVAVLAWLGLLGILRRAGLKGWYMLAGVVGLFAISFVVLIPILVMPLASFVASVAGIFGRLTGTFESYFKYGIIFVSSGNEFITLKIDFECSGIIEILLFLSWTVFFSVFNRFQKLIMSFVGTLYILVINAVRVIIICEIIHFGGNSWYGFAHNIAGKLFFYVFIVLFYFYVFTKQHIISMRLGDFGYDVNNKEAKK